MIVLSHIVHYSAMACLRCSVDDSSRIPPEREEMTFNNMSIEEPLQKNMTNL
jgi:hypothetical protein